MKLKNTLTALLTLSLSAFVFNANAEISTNLTEQNTKPLNAANFSRGLAVVHSSNPVLNHLTEKAHALTSEVHDACLNSSAARQEPDQNLKEEACQVLAIKALSSFSLCAVYNNPGEINDQTTDSCYGNNFIKYIKQ